MHGDPHLLTLDGTHYSFMAAGEFAMIRDACTDWPPRISNDGAININQLDPQYQALGSALRSDGVEAFRYPSEGDPGHIEPLLDGQLVQKRS